jgi:hypothetical protein
MGGKVVSVTTDGFITNLSDLEERLLNLPNNNIPLFRHFKNLVKDLNDFKYTNIDALELKNEGKGIVS